SPRGRAFPHPHSKFRPNTPRGGLTMTLESEVLFIDLAVSDVRTILAELRPGVEPVLLDAARPAAAQMAAALADRRDLAAVHIIAHGAPGRVGFAAGEWSLETLERDAGDLAAIGRALAEDGDLRLWSCDTARGAAGEAFVEALSEAAGADVSAAMALVGATALGGRWDLAVSAGAPVAPPLTQTGTASYAGVLSVEVTLTGSLDAPGIMDVANTYAVQYYVTNSSNVIVGSFSLPSRSASQFASVQMIVDVPLAGTYTLTAIR